MYIRCPVAMVVVWALLAAGLASTCGCETPADQRRALRSVDPLVRAAAVVRVTEARDADAVHKLVDLLEDGDIAVRLYAILGLRQLCGEDYGYRYYDGLTARAAAVSRWRDAIRNGEVTVLPADASPAGAPSGRAEPSASSDARVDASTPRGRTVSTEGLEPRDHQDEAAARGQASGVAEPGPAPPGRAEGSVVAEDRTP